MLAAAEGGTEAVEAEGGRSGADARGYGPGAEVGTEEGVAELLLAATE